MRQPFLLCFFFISTIAHAQRTPQTPTQTPVQALSPRDAYLEVVARYEKYPVHSDGTKLLLLMPGKPRVGAFPQMEMTGRGLNKNGEGMVFSTDAMGWKGSPMVPFTATEMEHVDELLAKLPEDRGVLPPEGLQMIVLIKEDKGDGYKVRIYDRARLPQSILELGRIWRWTWTTNQLALGLSLSPTSEWRMADGSGNSLFAATTDGSQILSRDSDYHLHLWDAQTHRQVEALPDSMPRSGNQVAFSPDGSLAVFAGDCEATLFSTKDWKPLFKFVEPWVNNRLGQYIRPNFSVDGKNLLMECLVPTGPPGPPYPSEPQMRIFDVTTGKRVSTLPEIPTGAVTYEVAPNIIDRAVYDSSQYKVLLWDTKRHRDIATLTSESSIERVIYSPDGRQVAVVTSQKDPLNPGQWGGYRIRVWQTADGKLVSEMTPGDSDSFENVANVLWSPDGQRLLGAVNMRGRVNGYEVTVWNSNSGQSLGVLNTGGQVINGMMLLSDGELVVGSHDNIVRSWNLKAALEEIDKFQKSLG